MNETCMIEHHRKTLLILIVLITLLGLFLRCYRLSSQSLWMDEISSVETARVPLDEIVERSASNNASPTYFLLLRPVVGKSNENIESKARLLSALAGTLSVPLFIGIVYLWRKDWRTALVGGLLLAINPLHIWYSQETRGYAVMLFFGLGCLLSFELARWKGKRWWAGYALFAVLAAAIHKTGLVFPLACGLWEAWQAVRNRLRYRELAPHLVLILVVGLLLVQKSYPPAKEYGRASSVLEILYTGLTFVGGYSFGPSLTEIQNYGAKAAVVGHAIQIGIAAVVLAMAGAVCIKRGRSFLAGKEVLLIGLGIGIVVIGSLVSSFPYNVRYALPALFGFLALIAAFAGGSPPKLFSRFVLAGILAVNLWADLQWFYVPNYRKGDSRAVAQWLVQNGARVRTWTVLPDYLGFSIKWYLDSNPEILSGYQPARESQTTSFPPVPDVLIIGRRHHLLAPDEIIGSYRTNAGEARAIHSIAGFELYIRESTGKPGNPAP